MFAGITVRRFRQFSWFIPFLLVFVPTQSIFAASASLSTDTVNIAVNETGSWTISGDDGRSQREFRWSLPSGLNISTGPSSNLDRFRVRSDRGYLQVQTRGSGSFSATVKVSSGNSGSYIMKNLRADISLSPKDVTVNVGESGGGGSGGGSSGGGSGGGSSGGGSSGNADYTLYIETGLVNITASPVTGNGATTISVWGYTTASGGRLVPGPVIESTEGATVTVEVVNNHNINHNFVIQGVTSDQTAIPPGGRRTYTFSTPNAGVFRYNDTLNNGVNRALGLFGALVVRTADGSKRAWTNGPSFNKERTWVVTDMDKPNWNQVANGGGNVNTGSYKPNYFLMNGMNGFQSMGDDANVNLSGNVGETFLVRMVNAGQFDQSLHFHGNHFSLIARNGNRLNQPLSQTTINLKSGETAMVLYKLIHVGHLPMHVHTAQMETGNGVYLNGTAAMIIGH